MSYYLYRTSAGVLEVLPFEIKDASEKGHLLLHKAESPIHVQAWLGNELPVTEHRRMAYPHIGDQLDALWHAMEAGELPMIPAFFDPIAAVKQRFPKKSN